LRFLLGLIVVFLIFLVVSLLALPTATLGLLLDVQLGGALDNIIAAALDVHAWIVRAGVLLDRVALLRLDRYLALFLDFGYFAAGCATAPLP
jgi:hypothetical protein